MSAQTRLMADCQVVIIDDDPELCYMLSELLRTDGYVTATFQSGEEGLLALRNSLPQLVILDVTMPDMDGFQVLRHLRMESDVPVLILTARGDDRDRITGFELGADDYLPKPFNPRELLLRVQAIMKRTAPLAATATTEVGPLMLERLKCLAHVGDRTAKLTSAEARALEALMRTPDRVVSKDELTRFALGRGRMPYERAIDTHISHLRTKIGKDDGGESPIRNVRGAGYLLLSEWEPAAS